MRVAVIGGGIAGFCAAIALRGIGADVEIFERASSVREIGAGLSLWPNATYALRELGLLEPCLRGAGRVRRIRLLDPEGREWAAAGIFERATPAICLGRPALLSILLAAVDQRRVHAGRRCEGVSQEGGHKPQVHFEGGQTLAFDVVVGADGMGSVVRGFVTDRLERPVYRGYQIWRGVAEIPLSSHAEEDITEAWGDGERFGIMPIGKGQACWYAARNLPDAPPPPGKAGLLERFRGWHAPIPEVLAATPDSAITRTPALDRPAASSWARGRVVLIGDAAHPMTPNLGQGTCQAIEDALVLSLVLKGDAPIEAALRRFSELRRRRATAITLGARWTGRFAQSEGFAARLLRRGIPRSLMSGALARAFCAAHGYRAGAEL